MTKQGIKLQADDFAYLIVNDPTAENVHHVLREMASQDPPILPSGFCLQQMLVALSQDGQFDEALKLASETQERGVPADHFFLTGLVCTSGSYPIPPNYSLDSHTYCFPPGIMTHQQNWAGAVEVFESLSPHVDPQAQVLAAVARSYYEIGQLEKTWETLERLVVEVGKYKQADWQLYEAWAIPFVLKGFAKPTTAVSDVHRVWELLDSIAISRPLFHLSVAAYVAREAGGDRAALPYVRKIYERVVEAVLAGGILAEPSVEVTYGIASVCLLTIRGIPEYATQANRFAREIREILIAAAIQVDNVEIPAHMLEYNKSNRKKKLTETHFGYFMSVYNRTLGRAGFKSKALSPSSTPDTVLAPSEVK